MTMQRYDTVLLDADRTLFDFDRSEHEAIRTVLARHGLPHDREALEIYLRENLACWAAFDRGELEQDKLGGERFRRTLRALDAEGFDPEEMNLEYLRTLAEFPYLIEGAEELCRALSPTCRLVIVTNGLTVAQTGRLENSALRPYISGLYISQAMGVQKPQKEYFDRVFAGLHLSEGEKRRTVLVGDSLDSDIRGGINAGIDTVWFCQNPRKSSENLKITFVAQSLDKVRSFILGQ